MNKLVAIAISIMVCTTNVIAQSGFTPVKNHSNLEKVLKQAQTSGKGVMSDFTQIKSMKLLAEEMKSKGKFYFSHPQKMRIEYLTPFKYLVIYNQGIMTVKDEKKTNKVNVASSKSMQSLNRLMIDCMSGNMLSNKDFKVSAQENSQSYWINMLPIEASMKKLYQKIDVYVDKSNGQVKQLVLAEVGGDITTMNFTNTNSHAVLDEKMFKTK